MPRDGSQPRVGGCDQRSAAAGITRPHTPHPFGELLHVGFRQPAPHVPEQHPVPAGGEAGERVHIADVDVGEIWRRGDQPDARLFGFGKQVGSRRRRQPDAVEAQSRDRLERLSVVIEAPWKEWQPTHLQHAPCQRRRWGSQRCGGSRLNEGRLPHGKCGTRVGGWCGLGQRGRGGNQTLHAQVVDGQLVMARRGVEFEDEVGDHSAREAASRTVLSAKRGKLAFQSGHDVGCFEELPAVWMAGGCALHHDMDRLPGLPRRKVWQCDPHAEPNGGTIGTHPDSGTEFIDHTCGADRKLQSERRTRGRVEHEPFASIAPMGRFALDRMAMHTWTTVGVGE